MRSRVRPVGGTVQSFRRGAVTGPSPRPWLKIIGIGRSGKKLVQHLAASGLGNVEFFFCHIGSRIVKLLSCPDRNAAQEIGETGSFFWDKSGLTIQRGDLILLLMAPDEKPYFWLINKIHSYVRKVSATLAGVTWSHGIGDRDLDKFRTLLRGGWARRRHYVESVIVLNAGKMRFPVPGLHKLFAARDVCLEAAALVSILKEDRNAQISIHIEDLIGCWFEPQFIITGRGCAEGKDRGSKAANEVLDKIEALQAGGADFDWLLYSLKATAITCEEVEDIGSVISERIPRNAMLCFGVDDDTRAGNRLEIMGFAGSSLGHKIGFRR